MKRARWVALAILVAVLPWGTSPGREDGLPLPDPITLGDSSRLQAVLSAGYHERLQLGLGSPFRLIDLVLHDPRLDPAARTRIAQSLLARTLGGSGYRIDPPALDVITHVRVGPWPGSGRHHLALIDDAITDEADPRTGELVVRLAYRLAVMEGSIAQAGVGRAAYAAALLRDREVARRDAQRLVAEARRAGRDPVELVPAWRRALRFEVERAVYPDLPPREVRRAVDQASRLLARIRSRGGYAAPALPPPAPALPRSAAAALARTAERTGFPPQTAVSVRVRFADQALRFPEGPRERAWAAFARHARNEEQLVAQRALLLARAPGLRRAVAGLVLDAAVGLRTFAQEPPWFPGFGGPTRREVMARHGIWVVLDGDVPRAWGPHYRAAVDRAATRLREVLPGVSLRGLTVRVSREPGSEWALARHNARKRIIEWPALTGPGTLAHEIAHDLDRQAAVRLYGVRGVYASNRAARAGRGALPHALERLSEPSRGLARGTHPRALEPAEVFARNVDWLVTTELARRGIRDGYLSSAQDDVLTGHGTVRPPGPPGLYDKALRTAVGALVPGRSPLGAGAGHAPSPTSVLRLVAAPATGPGSAAGLRALRASPGSRLDGVRFVRARAHESLRRWTCSGAPAGAASELADAHRRLVEAGVAARARRAAEEAARGIGGPEAHRSLLRALYGAPRLVPLLRLPPPGIVRDLLAEVRAVQRSADLNEGCATAPLFAPSGAAWFGRPATAAQLLGGHP
jgi:hypothetical protein